MNGSFLQIAFVVKALAEIRISEEARGPDLEAGPDNRIVGQAPVINWPLNFIQLINHS